MRLSRMLPPTIECSRAVGNFCNGMRSAPELRFALHVMRTSQRKWVFQSIKKNEAQSR